MKSKLSHFALPTAALCWLLSVAATGCIATAFALPLTRGMGFPILLLGLFAGLVCVAFDRCKLTVPVLLFLCAQLLLMFSLKGNPAQMQTLLPSITEYYQRAYGWPIILENGPFAQYADLALLQVGLIICFFLCWTLMRRKPLGVCLLPLIPLLSCIVVYDTIPNKLYLFLLLLGLSVLWLTHSARRRRNGAAGTQSIKLTPLVALCLAVIFLFTPQTEDLNPLRIYANSLAPWIEQLIQNNGDIGITGSSSGTTVNLSTLGPKVQTNTPILYAQSSQSGRTYLRQKVMLYYDGLSWAPKYSTSLLFGGSASATGSIRIRTLFSLPYRYVPYYPTVSLAFLNGTHANAGEITYEFDTADTFRTSNAPRSNYKNLPDATAAWATPLVQTIVQSNWSVYKKASAIAQYVEDSALYSLRTPKMPSSGKDFAQWFLEESSTGYCVHFATAATILLRAAGIPAAYVEGLTFRAVANEEVEVTNANAHAWVEYYDHETSTWEILDPTPSIGIPGGGDASGNPDDPDTPDTPDTPDDPDTPDNPDTPDTPDDPDTPNNPDNPDTPDDPDTPDGPAQPDTPDLPNMTPDDYAKEDWHVWLSQRPWPIKAGLCGAGLVSLLLLQALLRRWYHRRRWRRGTTNRQALQRFRQCRKLAKLLRIELPQSLLDVAEKARYGQHTLDAEELICFDAFLSDARVAGAGAPLHRRLVRFLIAAL